ncbi:MAG: valine--tRNA ligase [Deltaproteobacteria bacterium]|nr:valine--tRNA ligase [Deltaproteobacteria bacterium]
MDLAKAYEPGTVEEKWYRRWRERGYFRGDEKRSGAAFSMVIPPPNITGSLHMGHALNNTIQDILCRYHRMRGDVTLWIPGTDHAGIATQNVVERQLAGEGVERRALGRERFVERVWSWKKESGSTITRQLARLGVSCDWERERFTMDEGLSRAVREVFVTLYEEGLIYRDRYLINWCPRCQTALSDLESEHQPVEGRLWYIRYPRVDGRGFVVVATTRPETLLGDTAVAVHPDDERYRDLVGTKVILPAVGVEIPVISDEAVSREFGTGVVKVTPGHDPNDYLMGRRHGLEMISVLDTRARMTGRRAGPYALQDRLECRARIVEDLERAGLVEKVEPHAHSVGHCYRCRTVVEPMLSVQWFVRIAPLAEPAIAAVREGRTRFVPEHWEKVYFGWMENIRDWCISRQLWWGHQIPAWYCRRCDAQNILGADEDGNLLLGEDAEPIVSRTDPTECARGHRDLVRDSDVLDTWFSSALWPFSTMGWPEKTETLARFYPTSALVTGFDIIFFWVARMMMMGLHFMKEVPFRDVYVHALVRDEQGQKMSKSKGNVIDPLALLDRYGTDALRFTLVALSAMGRDIKLSEERVEGYRNFANKIWNAARFVLMNSAEDGEEERRPLSARAAGPEPRSALPAPDDDLTLADRWILHRLAATGGEVRDALDAYRFNEAAAALYRFLWADYCDWYLEMAKISLADPARRATTRRVLVSVLEHFLRLLHPFMPFLTEELWQALPAGRDAESIMLAPYPAADEAWRRTDVGAMDVVIEVIRAVRNLRADLNVAPTATLELVAFGDAAARLGPHEAYLRRLAGIRSIEGRADGERPRGAAILVVAGLEMAVPLRGVITDPAAEIARNRKLLEKLEKEMRGLSAKLGNAQFLERAPAEVVEKEREKHHELAERRATLERNLERLENL